MRLTLGLACSLLIAAGLNTAFGQATAGGGGGGNASGGAATDGSGTSAAAGLTEPGSGAAGSVGVNGPNLGGANKPLNNNAQNSGQPNGAQSIPSNGPETNNNTNNSANTENFSGFPGNNANQGNSNRDLGFRPRGLERSMDRSIRNNNSTTDANSRFSANGTRTHLGGNARTSTGSRFSASGNGNGMGRDASGQVGVGERSRFNSGSQSERFNTQEGNSRFTGTPPSNDRNGRFNTQNNGSVRTNRGVTNQSRGALRQTDAQARQQQTVNGRYNENRARAGDSGYRGTRGGRFTDTLPARTENTSPANVDPRTGDPTLSNRSANNRLNNRNSQDGSFRSPSGYRTSNQPARSNSLNNDVEADFSNQSNQTESDGGTRDSSTPATGETSMENSN